MKNDNIEKIIRTEVGQVVESAIAHMHTPGVLDETLKQLSLALGLVISLAACGDDDEMDELVSKAKKVARNGIDKLF